MYKIKANSFTRRYKYITSSIKTNCEISEAFGAEVPIEEEPHFENVTALWDTGATNSCISNNLASKLNLIPIGFEEMSHADGTSTVPTYLINVFLPNNVGFSYVLVLGCDLQNMDAIIGMDIISQGDFAISNFEGNTCFSFRIPSTQHINFVGNKPKIAENKIGRNEPCHCGSGKKYKNCCGKNL